MIAKVGAAFVIISGSSPGHLRGTKLKDDTTRDIRDVNRAGKRSEDPAPNALTLSIHQ